MNWRVIRLGLHRWEPAPGHVYQCERVNLHSLNYFVHINEKTMRTPGNKFWRASLAECKATCERHYEMNTMGGEVP